MTSYSHSDNLNLELLTKNSSQSAKKYRGAKWGTTGRGGSILFSLIMFQETHRID